MGGSDNEGVDRSGIERPPHPPIMRVHEPGSPVVQPAVQPAVAAVAAVAAATPPPPPPSPVLPWHRKLLDKRRLKALLAPGRMPSEVHAMFRSTIRSAQHQFRHLRAQQRALGDAMTSMEADLERDDKEARPAVWSRADYFMCVQQRKLLSAKQDLMERVTKELLDTYESRTCSIQFICDERRRVLNRLEDCSSLMAEYPNFAQWFTTSARRMQAALEEASQELQAAPDKIRQQLEQVSIKATAAVPAIRDRPRRS